MKNHRGIKHVLEYFIFLGKFCDIRMSIEEIESQRIPLAERMVREPFWLGLITVLVVMIVIGVGYLVKKHLPEKIEKILRTNQEAALASRQLDQNISGIVFINFNITLR